MHVCVAPFGLVSVWRHVYVDIGMVISFPLLLALFSLKLEESLYIDREHRVRKDRRDIKKKQSNTHTHTQALTNIRIRVYVIPALMNIYLFIG